MVLAGGNLGKGVVVVRIRGVGWELGAVFRQRDRFHWGVSSAGEWSSVGEGDMKEDAGPKED